MSLLSWGLMEIWGEYINFVLAKPLWRNVMISFMFQWWVFWTQYEWGFSDVLFYFIFRSHLFRSAKWKVLPLKVSLIMCSNVFIMWNLWSVWNRWWQPTLLSRTCFGCLHVFMLTETILVDYWGCFHNHATWFYFFLSSCRDSYHSICMTTLVYSSLQ